MSVSETMQNSSKFLKLLKLEYFYTYLPANPLFSVLVTNELQAKGPNFDLKNITIWLSILISQMKLY